MWRAAYGTNTTHWRLDQGAAPTPGLDEERAERPGQRARKAAEWGEVIRHLAWDS